ncbi:hypothetical protein CA13_71810 [Planctomycetes bacterium CA13]|uniref:SMP-30/Gluconolaconase/LRE-like region n=1 Tax=Novipirellula herctigrandis TaxID=2527986 RepID=A0A5C5YP57_9BACT|nr:hypothetical protein CA13_71810 [Planctomycetes bacterium CA13]
MFVCFRPLGVSLFLLFILSESVGLQSNNAQNPAIAARNLPEKSEVPVYLNEPAVSESSGLASSRRVPGYFWTHNDSGDTARVFAFDCDAKRVGVCKLKSAPAVDWEDMAAFCHNGQNRLLLADCGDNLHKRASISLLIVDEPDPTTDTATDQFGAMTVTYPDGPRDCEAVAVDSSRGQVLLLTKSALPICRVYSIPLSTFERPLPFSHAIEASYVGAIAMPMVTGADFDSATGDLWVVNYWNGFCVRCKDREMRIADQIRTVPAPVKIPRWRQVEAVAVDDNGRAWVTSEGAPMPFGSVKMEE